MILLLDIGNTNLRWTCHGVGIAWEVQILRHQGGVPLDLLAAWERLDAPTRVLISNVAGDAVAAAVRRVVLAYWRLEPEFVSTRAFCLGVRVAYSDPARFGVDRWLTLLAAHGQSRQAVLILDAGTAATFDLMLADGQHLGGLILPGVEMMRASLLAGTAIPPTEAKPTSDPWATDTGTAVTAGSVQSITALAGRLYDRLAADTGSAPRLLLTGGDAERLRAGLDRPFEHVPQLVLLGLARLAED
jgi:type III pantothenate kinase